MPSHDVTSASSDISQPSVSTSNRKKYVKKFSHVWVEKGASPASLCTENVKSESNSSVAKKDDPERTLKHFPETYDQKPKEDSQASTFSLKLFPVIHNQNSSSVLQISSNDITLKSKTKNRRNKKTFDHILSSNVASASSRTPESLLKSPDSSDPVRPLISTSENLPSHPAKYWRKVGIISFDHKGVLSTSLRPANSIERLIEKGTFPHSPNLPFLSMKPTISLASSNSTSLEKKGIYNRNEKEDCLTYSCPEDFKSLIEKDIVPEVLKKPLSMSTYKEYFQALLYAEDVYLEKWDGFEMKNVILKLHNASILMRKGKRKFWNGFEYDDKTFVAFEIDKVPERRPFLLSRDFVTVWPLTKNNNKKKKSFQGIIYRVMRSNLVLAEFGEDFHSQHDPFGAYNVKFSFNRVCLKRAHQAISAASEDLFRNFLFPILVAGNNANPTGPYVNYKVGRGEARALQEIANLQGPPPYLVEGPLSVTRNNQLSETGIFVVKTVFQICRESSSTRILLCAPTNRISDMFVTRLKKEILESDMFRANAAFRKLDGVPEDVLPSCLYETDQECFSCPSLPELRKFKVILSTYMSSFRLSNHGIMAGHFSHIFLVNASSITEPETLVPLANFANEKTTVIVTGASGNCSRWIRSTMAKRNGLSISYFERLRNSKSNENLDPHIITIIEDSEQKSVCQTCGSSFCVNFKL